LKPHPEPDVNRRFLVVGDAPAPGGAVLPYDGPEYLVMVAAQPSSVAVPMAKVATAAITGGGAKTRS
jgi:hypothetical protein